MERGDGYLIADRDELERAGNWALVRTRPDGTIDVVEAAGGGAGRAWQAPINLSAAGQNAGAPQVGVDGQGDAVAVWRRFNRSNWIVQAAAAA